MRKKWDERFAEYARKKAVRRIASAFMVSGCYGVVVTALRRFGFSFGEDWSLPSWLLGTAFDGQQFLVNYPMWFIIPFSLSQLAYCALRRGMVVVRSPRAREVGLALTGLVAVTVAATWGGEDGLPAGPALLLCRVFYFFGWVALGRIASMYADRLSGIRTSTVLLASVAIQLLVFYVCGGNVRPTPSWQVFRCGPVSTVLLTCTGIAVYFRLSQMFARLLNERGRACVRLLSGNTFSIMCHHMFGTFILNALVFGLGLLTGMFGLFDVGSWMTGFPYYYFPHSIEQFAVVYVVFSVLFSLGVHRCWLYVRSWVERWMSAAGLRGE